MGKDLDKKKCKKGIYTVMFSNCMFKYVLLKSSICKYKYIYYVTTVVYVFRCFTITELNGFRNTPRKWFMVLGKLFRKGVYVLTQRFSGSF